MKNFPFKKGPPLKPNEIFALKLRGLARELTYRANPENATIVRNTFIGAAALGITILVALTQVQVKDVSLKIAISCAAMSAPIWLVLAASLEIFLHLGEDSFQEYRKQQTSRTYQNLQLFAGVAL